MAYSYDRSKTAAAGTLLAAKAQWAKGVADDAAERFKSYGGWANQSTTSTVRVGSSGMVELTTRSDRYGWTGYATFDMEKQVVTAMMDVDAKSGEAPDFLKIIQQMDEKQKKITIDDRANPDKIIEGISLWWSKTINPLSERK